MPGHIAIEDMQKLMAYWQNEMKLACESMDESIASLRENIRKLENEED